MDQEKLIALLLAARCPDPGCDGFGTAEGENCIDPCQWCHERAEVLHRPDLLVCPDIEPQPIDDIDNDISF